MRKIYAIIETGGKQYKVSPGQTVDVERLGVAEGNTVELDRVLLLADGDKVTAGKPVVEGAMVIATARSEGRSKKVVAFKYKAKVRYQKKTGHRQGYTRLSIDRIMSPGEAEPAKKTTRRKKEAKEVTTDGA